MIINLSKLDKRFEALAGIDIKPGVEKAILLVEESAKNLCPVADGELRQSIRSEVAEKGDAAIGTCQPYKTYGLYVEFGTGPKGAANHEGISPDASPVYTRSPWWIHESQVDREIAEKYHWFYIDTPEGRFYQCTGQAAQPYMYPAMKNNEKDITRIIADEARKALK